MSVRFLILQAYTDRDSGEVAALQAKSWIFATDVGSTSGRHNIRMHVPRICRPLARKSCRIWSKSLGTKMFVSRWFFELPKLLTTVPLFSYFSSCCHLHHSWTQERKNSSGTFGGTRIKDWLTDLPYFFSLDLVDAIHLLPQTMLFFVEMKKGPWIRFVQIFRVNLVFVVFAVATLRKNWGGEVEHGFCGAMDKWVKS